MLNSLDELLIKAENLLLKKKFENAIKVYKKILNSHPNEVTAKKNIGIAYFELGKYDKALENFKNATEIEISDSEIWSYIAQIYLQRKEKEKALWCFNKAYEIEKKLYDNEFKELIGLEIEEKKKLLENKGIIPIDPDLEPVYIICSNCNKKILIDKNSKFCRNCGMKI